MAFRYVVKKRMVGIGTKTEKYVAASYSVANIDFDRLCDQVTSQGMVPRGIVKAVLDGMIDALCTYASIGATVRLGDFGSLRPGLNGKSQEDAKSVTADVVYRQKLIFVPGQRLKVRASVVWQGKHTPVSAELIIPTYQAEHILLADKKELERLNSVSGQKAMSTDFKGQNGNNLKRQQKVSRSKLKEVEKQQSDFE